MNAEEEEYGHIGEEEQEQEQKNEEADQIQNEDENINIQERDSLEMHNDEINEIQYNIEEYFPYESKHDQYSCSCCQHYYEEAIKKNTSLPTTKCEVCGNDINQRSLTFYQKKHDNKKKRLKGKGKK